MPCIRIPLLLCLAGLFAAAPAVQAEDRDGEAVYNCTCIVCHGNGLLGAPKLGDKKRWAKLIREGLDDLAPSALGGEDAMPPKGNNPNLSDMEVARATVFMANAAGGEFAEPSAADVTRWRELADRRQEKKKTRQAREKK
jgi:cytochrome c5